MLATENAIRREAEKATGVAPQSSNGRQPATGKADAAAIQALGTRLQGQLVQPEDEEYGDARKVWNGLIDRRPALIVRCSGAADVIEAVNFAREQQMLLSVRGGGHNVAGNAVNDGGLVIDLSPMRGVWVDPQERTVRVGGGATLGDIDRETQVFGLATPTGNVSVTGIGGLGLHGGIGHLRRKYGLSVDNLLSVDIVTADGQLRRASAGENPELFWAVRGAGSNFGVVTSFEFRLHPVGPLVLFCGVFYALEDAPQVLPAWRDFVREAPDELSTLAALWIVPPAPSFPEGLHFQPAVGIAGVYCGPLEEGERLIAPLRNLATPLLDMSGPAPYTVVQSAVDGAFPPGLLAYWKSLYLDSLSDDLIRVLLHRFEQRPSPITQVSFLHHGGAISRVQPDAMAFPHRQAPFMVGIDATWMDPQDSERNIAWARETWATAQHMSGSGVYLNFPGLGEDGASLVRAGYGANYDRLAALKRQYDPGNLFRMNQNIQPASEGGRH